MDRLFRLRKSLTSISRNTSISSELGYETAQDDSISSVYYSMDEDTLTDIDVASPSPPSHGELTITTSLTQTLVTEPIDLYQPNITSNSNVVGVNLMEHRSSTPSTNQVFLSHGLETITTEAAVENLNFNSSPGPELTEITESSEETVIAQQIESTEPLQLPMISSNSNIVGDNLMQVGPASSSMSQHNGPNNELQSIGVNAPAQSFIFNLPTGPAIPSSNVKIFTGNSSIVQDTVTAAQQQSNKAAEPNRVARRMTVRFQDDSGMPRRRNDLARRSELPRRATLSIRSQVNTETRTESRRTLIDKNDKNTRPETNRKVESHICDICKMAFTLRSTLNVHKTSHKTDCKYCDRSFKKALALSIHLKENCDKIPLAVRRKIITKEFKNASSKL